MRSLDPAIEAALNSGEFDLAHLITIEAADDAGDPVVFAFHDGLDPLVSWSVETPSGTVSRSFAGAGALVGVGDVRRSASGEIHTFSVALSGASAAADDMVRGHLVRGRPLQYHRMFLDPLSRLPIAAAPLWFSGFVDGAPLSDSPAGVADAETVWSIVAVSHMRMLTVPNPARKSDAHYRVRRPLPGGGGDRIYKHASRAPALYWGEARPGQNKNRRKK